MIEKQGTGWKIQHPPKLPQPPLENLSLSNEVEKIFDKTTFSLSEIFFTEQNNVNYTFTYSNSFGRIYFVQPEEGSVTTNLDTTIKIHLNASLNFYMVCTKFTHSSIKSHSYSVGHWRPKVWIYDGQSICSSLS